MESIKENVFVIIVIFVYIFFKKNLDYDGPLSEAGDTTPKYHTIKAIIEQYAPENSSEL